MGQVPQEWRWGVLVTTPYRGRMCRSIKTLRPPYTPDVSDEEITAAALQYVRKVAGMRQPSARNRSAFEQAVEAVAVATRALLADVGAPAQRGPAQGRPVAPREQAPADA